MNPYRALAFRFVRTRLGRWWSHRLYTTFGGPRLDRLTFRLSGGRLTSCSGVMPLLLITTTGRVTGIRRTTPVVYLRRGDDVVLVASNVGNPSNPRWFGNLLANPTVTLAVGRRSAPYETRIAAGDERAHLWRHLTEHAPTYSINAERADRELPVVIATPAKRA